MKIKLIVFTSILLVFYSCTPSTNIYLVRHAEKLNQERESPLSEAGKLRVRKLTSIMQSKKIDHIYSSDYLRTTETVKPLAIKLHKEIELYKTDSTSLILLSNKLSASKGKNFLVVGHSNTLPLMIKQLTNKNVSIKEDEYDKLFKITFKYGKTQRVNLKTKQFGNSNKRQ